jgi:hypothetical protein
MKSSFNALISRKSWDWATPKDLYEQLDKEFAFDFDPCPLGAVENGKSSPLMESWNGRRVFCNPPYGPEIIKFLRPAQDTEVAVFLLPARTDTLWFHEFCLNKAKEIRFIKGRLRFRNATNGAPFSSMVVVFSREVLPLCSDLPILSQTAKDPNRQPLLNMQESKCNSK